MVIARAEMRSANYTMDLPLWFIITKGPLGVRTHVHDEIGYQLIELFSRIETATPQLNHATAARLPTAIRYCFSKKIVNRISFTISTWSSGKITRRMILLFFERVVAFQFHQHFLFRFFFFFSF